MIQEQWMTPAISSYLKSEVLHLQLTKNKLDSWRFLHSQEIEKQARGSHWGSIPPTVLSLYRDGWVGQKGLCMSHSPAVPRPPPDTKPWPAETQAPVTPGQVCDSCVAHMLNKWSYCDEMSAPPLTHMGLLQHKHKALSCADSPERAESVQQLSVMSDYLFWKAHGALGTAKCLKDSKL